MNTFHRRYDVYMTATTATPAPHIGETSTPRALAAFGACAARLGLSRAILSSNRVRALIRFKIAWAPFTELANLTGAPAMSVPLHWTVDELPMGIHFMSRRQARACCSVWPVNLNARAMVRPKAAGMTNKWHAPHA